MKDWKHMCRKNKILITIAIIVFCFVIFNSMLLDSASMIPAFAGLAGGGYLLVFMIINRDFDW